MSRLPAVIAPSILSADFARLGEEVTRVIAEGADWIHFDVMDNHYVPNLTIGPLLCEALRKHGITAPIDVHLMVSPVDAVAQMFAKAGASHISFHPEATQHVDRSLQAIRDAGCTAGLVFNPATPLDYLRYGGQSFISSALDKLREARRLIDAYMAAHPGRQVRLEIDGGVKVDNIGEIAAAGADTFVAGSAIFGARDYAATIRAMREAIARG
jgi:ribulose-phosphate 3-epimerase